MSPFEQILIAVLVGAGALGAIVWIGAAAAAAVSGNDALDAGLSDAFGAIGSLATAPDRPADAWPPPAAAQLPGPVVYWLCTALVAVSLIVVLMIGRRIWKALSSSRRRLGVDAHARFANKREIRPLMVSGPAPGLFIFGTWGGRLLATENRRWAGPDPRGLKRWRARATGELRRGQQGDVTSIAITGPTRCGKTSQCAIPGLLQWDAPAIVLSVKRDLMDITIGQRRTLGEVRVFDPGGFLATSSSHITVTADEVGRWSPLRMAHTPSGAKKAGEAMAAWTPQAGVEGGMDFWSTQGKLLFTGLLGASALSDQPSMRDVAEWVFDMSMPDSANGCPPEDILRNAVLDPDARDAGLAAVRHLSAIWKKPDPKLIASVYATAQTVCDPWLDPNVIAATDIDGDGEWIDLDWLMDTGVDGDQANTLYLLVSLDDYNRLAPVLAGLLSDLKSQAYEWEMRGDRLPAPLLMLIDEAGNMPLDWLPEVSSTCAGIGIQLVTIWQSYAQIHEAYGKRADTLLTNHATKLFFPGASDDSTLGYVSKIVGDEEIERRSWSNDMGSSGRRSISGQSNNEAMVPYFLARLPEYGSALLIHSNMPPAHIYGREWWRNKKLRAMVPAPPPFRSESTGTGPWQPTATRRRRHVPQRPTPSPTPVEVGPVEEPVSVPAARTRPTPIIRDLNEESEVSS